MPKIPRDRIEKVARIEYNHRNKPSAEWNHRNKLSANQNQRQRGNGAMHIGNKTWDSYVQEKQRWSTSQRGTAERNPSNTIIGTQEKADRMKVEGQY